MLNREAYPAVEKFMQNACRKQITISIETRNTGPACFASVIGIDLFSISVIAVDVEGDCFCSMLSTAFPFLCFAITFGLDSLAQKMVRSRATPDRQADVYKGTRQLIEPRSPPAACPKIEAAVHTAPSRDK